MVNSVKLTVYNRKTTKNLTYGCIHDISSKSWTNNSWNGGKRVTNTHQNRRILRGQIQVVYTEIKSKFSKFQHWFCDVPYLNPGQAKEPKPTAKVRHKTEAIRLDQKAAISMKTVCDRNPTQLKTFRTWVVVRSLFSRSQSASWPENWMRMDMTR